jgi:hypothetical protein
MQHSARARGEAPDRAPGQAGEETPRLQCCYKLCEETLLVRAVRSRLGTGSGGGGGRRRFRLWSCCPGLRRGAGARRRGARQNLHSRIEYDRERERLHRELPRLGSGGVALPGEAKCLGHALHGDLKALRLILRHAPRLDDGLQVLIDGIPQLRVRGRARRHKVGPVLRDSGLACLLRCLVKLSSSRPGQLPRWRAQVSTTSLPPSFWASLSTLGSTS